MEFQWTHLLRLISGVIPELHRYSAGIPLECRNVFLLGQQTPCTSNEVYGNRISGSSLQAPIFTCHIYIKITFGALFTGYGMIGISLHIPRCNHSDTSVINLSYIVLSSHLVQRFIGTIGISLIPRCCGNLVAMATRVKPL